MAFDAYHDFVRALERAGELIRIESPLATELEITAAADFQMKKPEGGKALWIGKPTVNGRVVPMPVAINTMGSWKRMALAMGVEHVDEVARELGELVRPKPPSTFREAIRLLGMALELRHARPRLVTDGPCKEIKHRFEIPQEPAKAWPLAPNILNGCSGATSVDVHGSNPGGSVGCHSPGTWPTWLELPVLKCWPGDGGRFLTLPCVVTQDPDTGERNVGMYRMQIYDALSGGMHWQLQKVGARHGRRYYATGQRMPVAVFLGGDPMYAFAATAPLPDGLDEFLLAGFLRRKSVDLVKCETSDLEVPANADIVIEGFVDPREPLREEGPFGDHTGYYTLPEPYPVFHVTAITHRRDATYPATIVGRPPMEDFYMGSASVKIFLPVLKMNFPEIVDIALPAEGVFHNLVFVSIRKSYPMQAYKIMHGLWGMGQMMFTKYLVVVDADVNVHDTSEVLFRLCANTDPGRDVIITRGPADVLDHATSEVGIGGKLGLDATRKLAGEGFKRPWPPVIAMDPAVQRRVEQILGHAR